MNPPDEFAKALEVLRQGEVKFILIGGLAAILHGAARATYDVDIVYARDAENIERLCAVLAPYRPYPRGAPPGLPFTLDPRTVRNGLNFTLTMHEVGDLDLLGEVTGGGGYDLLLPFSEPVRAFGHEVHCVTLEKLIEIKRAAGRPKDFEAIAELEAVRRERTRKYRPTDRGA